MSTERWIHRFLKPVCSSKYQLRLYCTTSTFYTPDLRSSGPCPIEFPPTCKVCINGVPLQANLEGLKKKPGTAPPADLGMAVRMMGQNRIEMVYANSQPPVARKVSLFALFSLQMCTACHWRGQKFYLQVFLVEVTTVAELVARLKKGKYRRCVNIMTQSVFIALRQSVHSLPLIPQRAIWLWVTTRTSFQGLKQYLSSVLCVFFSNVRHLS